MSDRTVFRPNLEIFGVHRTDPGWLYLLRNGTLLKVGRTRNPNRRAREAKTWLPDAEVIGFKPFWEVGKLERALHAGLANLWHSGEWHDSHQINCEFLLHDFRDFYDDDRDMNSVDFIYWFNSSGLAEVAIEGRTRKISLREWQRQASLAAKALIPPVM